MSIMLLMIFLKSYTTQLLNRNYKFSKTEDKVRLEREIVYLRKQYIILLSSSPCVPEHTQTFLQTITASI